MSSFSGLPNVGSLIPSIDQAFINFEEIPVGRKTCDVCGDYFSITRDLQDCPVGLPVRHFSEFLPLFTPSKESLKYGNADSEIFQCGHVHCFGCTWTWLHRNHSCPECDTKYVIQPICVALKREAYLCRYQGFPPSGQSQLGRQPTPGHVADSMDTADDDDDATIADPNSPGVKELSREDTCLSIGSRTEGTKGKARPMHMLTESRDGIFINYTCVRSGIDITTQEFEAKTDSEQSRKDRWQALYEEKLRKSKQPHQMAKYYKMPFVETDSQRAERLERGRVYEREHRANETEEERAKRLEKSRRWRIRRRATETADEREERLAKTRKGAKRVTKQ